MKTLPLTLPKNGFTYTLVCREGNVAIYEQRVSEKVKYYEVILIKIRPEQLFKNVIREAHEVFPCNEDFGKTAWSCRTLADAMNRFNALVDAQLEKEKIKTKKTCLWNKRTI